MQQQNAVFQQLIVLLSKRLLCLHPELLRRKINRNILFIGITGDIPLNNGQRTTNQEISNPWTWRDHLTIDTRTNALIHVGNPENLPDDVAFGVHQNLCRNQASRLQISAP